MASFIFSFLFFLYIILLKGGLWGFIIYFSAFLMEIIHNL